MTGCSGSKTTTVSTPASPPPASKTSAAASSTESSATETAPVTPLDSSQCVTVDGANSDASDKDADTLGGFNPPASVKSSIEHFVGTGGAHFDDPDYTKNEEAIKDWVAALCPS